MPGRHSRHMDPRRSRSRTVMMARFQLRHLGLHLVDDRLPSHCCLPLEISHQRQVRDHPAKSSTKFRNSHTTIQPVQFRGYWRVSTFAIISFLSSSDRFRASDYKQRSWSIILYIKSKDEPRTSSTVRLVEWLQNCIVERTECYRSMLNIDDFSIIIISKHSITVIPKHRIQNASVPTRPG